MSEQIEYAVKTLRPIGRNLLILLKWLTLAVLVGLVAGGVSTLFAKAMGFVTTFRMENPWLILLLPVGGIIIVTAYRLLHNENDRGTNLILAEIHKGGDVPSRVAPLIIFSTVVSHFFGASVGREGAALQLGGSIGSFLGRIIRLDEKGNDNVRHECCVCGIVRNADGCSHIRDRGCAGRNHVLCGTCTMYFRSTGGEQLLSEHGNKS